VPLSRSDFAGDGIRLQIGIRGAERVEDTRACRRRSRAYSHCRIIPINRTAPSFLRLKVAGWGARGGNPRVELRVDHRAARRAILRAVR
jgi:hypothetical protein